MKWYTYVLIDPRTEEVFYVGKGTGKRLYQHDEKHNNAFMAERISAIKAAGFSVLHEKWFESDDEDFCYWMENYLIDYFGRKNLCNLTRGGEGPPSGENHPSKDPKVRAKLSKSIRAAHANPEVRAKMRAAKLGKKHSAETNAKMRAIMTGREITWDTIGMRGRRHSEESLIKMSAAKVGKRVSPETEIKPGQHVSIATEFSNEYFKKNGHPMSGKQHSESSRLKMKRAKCGDLISSRDVAEALNVTTTTTKRWFRQGMPKTSLEEALKWAKENCSARRRTIQQRKVLMLECPRLSVTPSKV